MPFKSVHKVYFLRDKITYMNGLDCTTDIGYFILDRYYTSVWHGMAILWIAHFADIHQQARIGIVETAIIMTKMIARQSSRL